MRKERCFILGLCLGLIFSFLCFSAVAEAESTIQEIQEEINETLKDKLNLTEMQLKKIKEEQAKQIAKRKMLATQEDVKRKELKQELEKVDSDQKVIDSLVNDLNTVRADVIDLRVKSVGTLKSILDEEQYKKVVEIQQEEAQEKKEKKKALEAKWSKWKEEKKVKKKEKKKWYYYYW